MAGHRGHARYAIGSSRRRRGKRCRDGSIIVWAPVSGSIIDRFDTQATLWVSLFVEAMAVAALIPFIAAAHMIPATTTVVSIVVLSSVSNVFAQLSNAARQATLAYAIPKDLRPRAVRFGRASPQQRH